MSTHESRRRRPLWLVEALDVAEQRRGVLLAVAGGLSLVAVVVALVAPGIIPPVPLVGAAVGTAALLLGYAAAVAVDAADLTLRGPRHVRAAGGDLLAVVPPASADEARSLAATVLAAREDDERLLLGLTACGRDDRAMVAWSEALAEALARSGVSVLLAELAAGRTEDPGVLEVVEGDARLSRVARIDPDLRLARVGAGRDLHAALRAMPTLLERLPRDLDVLVVALPSPPTGQSVGAARALDHVLVVAERDRDARVDLIAALDVLEGGHTSAQALLVDERTLARLDGWSAAEPAPTDRERVPSAPAPSSAAPAAEPPERGPDAPADEPPRRASAEAPADESPGRAPGEAPADEPKTSPSRDEQPVEPRDAEVVVAAEAARAALRVETAAAPAPVVRALGRRAPDAVRADPSDRDSSGEPTQELPAVVDDHAAPRSPVGDTRPEPRPITTPTTLPTSTLATASPEEVDSGEDPVRVTAQLALLADELRARNES